MQTQAAVLWDYGRDWEIEELTLDDPREEEVLIRLAASGLCHSDEHLRIGDLPMEALPAVGGHEGAGVVEAVGPGVRSVAEGDHVVLSFIPVCGRCHWCAVGRENLCEYGAGIQVGLQRDGTVPPLPRRRRPRGRRLQAGLPWVGRRSADVRRNGTGQRRRGG